MRDYTRFHSFPIAGIEPSLLEQTRTDVFERAHGSFTFAAPVFVDPQLRGLFEAAFAHARIDAPLNDKMICETTILKLTARLGAHSTSIAASEPEAAACVRRARARIDDDPTARLTLEDLARESGLSRYQLLRGFARELGLTPHAYILQRRLALARQLIRSGQGLAEVAVVAGFYVRARGPCSSEPGPRRPGPSISIVAMVRMGRGRTQGRAPETYWTIPDRQIETSVVLTNKEGQHC